MKRFWNQFVRPQMVFDWRDLIFTVVILVSTFFLCTALQSYMGEESSTAALLFVLAVTVISRLTSGVIFGFVASVVATFCINFFFMFPYASFTLSLAGYPLAFIATLVVAAIICSLTAQVKAQAEQAELREQRTRELYRTNERLSREQERIRMEADRIKMRNTLLRSLSHDLRTPMTAISGASSVILDRWDNLKDEDIKHMIRDVQTDADWLNRMMENILFLTRINQENAQVKKVPEAVEEVISEVIVKMRKRYPDIDFRVHVPDEFCMVPMDAVLIEQMLLNLMENAVRHSGNREGICLSAEHREGGMLFQVKDAGKGMSAEDLRHFSEDYYFELTDSGDATRGTGIGLSVCKTIAKAHQSELTVQNGENGGAIFSFLLPMKEEQESGD